MKIILLSWENFGTEDMKEAFCRLGHEVILLKTSQEELLSEKIMLSVKEACANASKQKDNIGFVFGFNYFPFVAEVCKEISIPYVSWVYDNPCVQLYSYTVVYPTNHIFVFDSDTYLKFSNQNISTVSYLPMAAGVDRLSKLLANNDQKECDISFVGSLYTEEHNFYSRMIDKGLDAYTSGYIRGLMEAQKRIYGYNLIEDKLTDEIITNMHAALPLEPTSDSVISQKTLFADFVLNRQITAEERKQMLKQIGTLSNAFSDFSANLYTRDKSFKIDGWTNNGSIDFFEGAPKVFNASKININISLRSIVNGIPLRCFEIMGSGGFLLTNYQGDFETLGFVDGEDYVSFESIEDMLEKCVYYLEHDGERKQIAMNGYNKVAAAHTYVHRAKEIIESVCG